LVGWAQATDVLIVTVDERERLGLRIIIWTILPAEWCLKYDIANRKYAGSRRYESPWSFQSYNSYVATKSAPFPPFQLVTENSWQLHTRSF
jgi:hypothetical protein